VDLVGQYGIIPVLLQNEKNNENLRLPNEKKSAKKQSGITNSIIQNKKMGIKMGINA